jgi:hypothetical protein
MPGESIKEVLEQLTKDQLKALAGEFGVRVGSKDSKTVLVEKIVKGVPGERLEALKAKAEELLREKRTGRAARGGAAPQAPELGSLLRELAEIRRLLEERLPSKVPSFREFAQAVLEEYWRLSGGWKPDFVRYERLRDAVCSRLVIAPQVFDTWFEDLHVISKGRLSWGESRDSKGRVVHVYTTAKTLDELLRGE